VSTRRQGSYLVASVRHALDDSEMIRFQRDVIEQIGQHRFHGVIIDVGGLDVLDSFGTMTLRNIAEMSRRKGALTVIVGIQPNVALAMVQMGLDTGTVPTALDLKQGLDFLDRQAGATGTRWRSGGR
jgi:rsbT antagonist protein RsbS